MSRALMSYLTDYTPAAPEAKEQMDVVRTQYAGLAHVINETPPDCAEKTAGLRHLLEAQDCHVRALLTPTRA